jgi:regulator of cell morphogenesis and NO signaling
MAEAAESAESLAEALEREHHEIDAGIEAFGSGGAPEAEREALVAAVGALRRHIYLEEEFFFPALSEAGLVAPVFVMLREHGQMWRTLDALMLELRADAGSAEVRTLIRELTVQLQHHNGKEEQILYPQADTALDGEAADRLRTFLSDGELPGDWIAQRAR